MYRNGLLHGITRHFYEDGNLKVESEFANEKPNGRNIIWGENGNILNEGYFKDGKPWEGSFESEDEFGKKTILKYKKGQLINCVNSCKD